VLPSDPTQIGSGDAPRTVKPTWSISGLSIEQPHGEPALLQHSAWTVTADGWTSVVTIKGCARSDESAHTVQLFVSHALPDAIASALATSLISLRLRSAPADSPAHLGQILVR
jgi:hypothetical protein